MSKIFAICCFSFFCNKVLYLLVINLILRLTKIYILHNLISGCMDKKDKFSTDFEALFNKELLKVKNGGSANELSALIKDYEYSINRVLPLSKECLSVYFASLLLSHKFNQLRFAVDRYAEVYTGPEPTLYKAVANEGRKNNFANLLKNTGQLQTATKSQLASLFTKAMKSYIIQALGKDYLNIQIAFLQTNYGITIEDLQSNGCEIDGKFATLPSVTKTDGLDDLMDDRIRQLANITESVIKS